MHHQRLTLPALALLAAGLLTAGCGDGDSSTTAPEPAGSSDTAENAAANAADIEFAQAMIPHHAQAVQMAQLVPGQDVTPELLALAEAVEAAQQPEIDQMTAMLEQWGADVEPTGEDEHAEHGSAQAAGMMSEADMDALGGAVGPEFEQMWLTMMIEHHQGAIAMAQDELADGTDDEAQTLAQKIIDAQEAEIAQMERLRMTP